MSHSLTLPHQNQARYTTMHYWKPFTDVSHNVHMQVDQGFTTLQPNKPFTTICRSKLWLPALEPSKPLFLSNMPSSLGLTVTPRRNGYKINLNIKTRSQTLIRGHTSHVQLVALSTKINGYVPETHQPYPAGVWEVLLMNVCKFWELLFECY